MIRTSEATTRAWLARSLSSLGPALRALADDPNITAELHPAELAGAADVIERTASCLRSAGPILRRDIEAITRRGEP